MICFWFHRRLIFLLSSDHDLRFYSEPNSNIWTHQQDRAEVFTRVHMTFGLALDLMDLCDLSLPVARWWSTGLGSVRLHPSGCSPPDACLSHWSSTASPSCLRWTHHTDHTQKSHTEKTAHHGKTQLQDGCGGVGQPICHVAGQEPARMMNGGSCVETDVTDINLQVDCISLLQYTLPLKKAICPLFNSASRRHQLHPGVSVWWKWLSAAVRLLLFFFFSFNFHSEYWCQSSEAIATGTCTICPSHR